MDHTVVTRKNGTDSTMPKLSRNLSGAATNQFIPCETINTVRGPQQQMDINHTSLKNNGSGVAAIRHEHTQEEVNLVWTKAASRQGRPREVAPKLARLSARPPPAD